MALSWPAIFGKAVRIASELRKKNPKLSQTEAQSAAWKTPEMKKLRAEYDAAKKSKEKKSSSKSSTKKKSHKKK